ncbi:hypothetical protein [Priestia megaterium]|uniref:hypothetical protein n=1 Tax=Priestia megaterium TaxID=1404 RepID=UPI001CDC3AC4|nr:hypothetical protein [Priestia megaterium]MCA4157888.1 hypothetical protein [Priestia megaterium]
MQPVYSSTGNIIVYYKIYSFSGDTLARKLINESLNKNNFPKKLVAKIGYKKDLQSHIKVRQETWEMSPLGSLEYQGDQPLQVQKALYKELWEGNKLSRTPLVSHGYDWNI